MFKVFFALILSSSLVLAKENYTNLYKNEKKGLSIELDASPPVAAMKVLRDYLLASHLPAMKEMEKDYARAIKNKEDPNLNLSVTYTASWANDNYISIFGSIYSFEGGAHGNTSFNAVLFDLVKKRPIPMSELIPEISTSLTLRTKLMNYIVNDIAIQKYKNENEKKPKPTQTELNTFIKDDFTLSKIKSSDDSIFRNFSLVGSGTQMPSRTRVQAIRFSYAPYEMGAYAEGMFDVEVPAEMIKPHVAAQYKGFFE